MLHFLDFSSSCFILRELVKLVFITFMGQQWKQWN